MRPLLLAQREGQRTDAFILVVVHVDAKESGRRRLVKPQRLKKKKLKCPTHEHRVGPA